MSNRDFKLRGYAQTKFFAFIGFIVLIIGGLMAPKQLAVIGIGLAVIPYVFFKVDFCRKLISDQQRIIDALTEKKNG